MKIIKQSISKLEYGYDLDSVFKHIERCGRICYKSENNITEDSVDKFVNRLMFMNHGAMLEHGTIYLYIEYTPIATSEQFIVKKYNENPYSKVVEICEDGFIHKCYITTNYRVIVDNMWRSDLKYLCKPTENHIKRYSFHIITNIAITRELIRHRHFSFANESTRYCNYTNGRFGNEITCVVPNLFDNGLLGHRDYSEILEQLSIVSNSQDENKDLIIKHLKYILSWAEAEKSYISLINDGEQPQFARDVLPVATKSEIIMTGFEDDWNHFLNLRLHGTTGKPHPEIEEIAFNIDRLLN